MPWACQRNCFEEFMRSVSRNHPPFSNERSSQPCWDVIWLPKHNLELWVFVYFIFFVILSLLETKLLCKCQSLILASQKLSFKPHICTTPDVAVYKFPFWVFLVHQEHITIDRLRILRHALHSWNPPYITVMHIKNTDLSWLHAVSTITQFKNYIGLTGCFTSSFVTNWMPSPLGYFVQRCSMNWPSGNQIPWMVGSLMAAIRDIVIILQISGLLYVLKGISLMLVIPRLKPFEEILTT